MATGCCVWIIVNEVYRAHANDLTRPLAMLAQLFVLACGVNIAVVPLIAHARGDLFAGDAGENVSRGAPAVICVGAHVVAFAAAVSPRVAWISSTVVDIVFFNRTATTSRANLAAWK